MPVVVCFSQAVVVDKTVYVSGQLGMCPTTGALVDGGVEAEAEQVCFRVSTGEWGCEDQSLWYYQNHLDTVKLS